MSTVSALKVDQASLTTREELLGIVFDGNYESVHQDVRELLFDPIFAHRSNLTLSQAGRLSYERSRALHRKLEKPLDILRNPLRLYALAEWCGLLDVSCFSLVMVHYNLSVGTVYDHGQDRDDIADYVDEMNSLASFSPYMATELGYGNNLAALRTEAVYDHASQTFVLNTPDPLAQKFMSYSGFGDIPKIAVVMARLKVDGADYGVFPFLVRLSTEQGLCEGIRAVSCPEKPVQGLDNGLTWFDHVRIPARNILLGDVAEITAEGKFKPVIANPRTRFHRALSRIIPGRLCVSSAATALGRASVYIALRYAQQRLTNAPGNDDVAIIEFRSHQLSTFTALAKAYALTLFANYVKREYVGQIERPSAKVLNLINIVKAVATWEMDGVVNLCRERCGAQGIFSINRIIDFGTLLPGVVTAEGDNQVLLAATAAQMLAQPWSERVPAPHQHAGSDLTDCARLVELLLFREHKLWTAAREQKEASEDKGYFGAWNDVINSGIEMARLHGIRNALQCLHKAAAEAENAEVGAALNLLGALFGLSELQRNTGWYLAHGVISSEQVLALPAVLDALCVALRDHVPMLLEGFALTPELLRAPIAYDDYATEFCRQVNAEAQ